MTLTCKEKFTTAILQHIPKKLGQGQQKTVKFEEWTEKPIDFIILVQKSLMRIYNIAKLFI